MAHTPGPWGIVFHGDVERIRLNGSTVYQVSDVTDPDFPSGEPRYCLDDLRLIAAAPEMLAALRDIISCAHINTPYGGKAYCISDGRMDAARAAIATAEGRTG